jgi:hypothetical protein
MVTLRHRGKPLLRQPNQRDQSVDSRSQRGIDVWNAATSKSRGHWFAHDYGVTVVTFSPDDY